MAHYILKADLANAEHEERLNNGFVAQVENGGWVSGAILDTKGNCLGFHTSSTLQWLEQDLLRKVDYDSERDTYEKNW